MLCKWELHGLIFNYTFSFEERAKYVESIAKQHKDPVMFEEFAALVFAPVLPQGAYSFLSLDEMMV